MRQDEFINCFREALIGKVPEQIIQDNVNYYKDYIASQIRSGQSEAEVLRALGDPRLLAKTIEESNKFAGNSSGNSYYKNNSNNGYYSSNYNYNGSDNGYSSQPENKNEKMLQFKGWFVLAIVILLLIIVVMLVFKVAVFLAPVALLIVAVSIIIKGIKQWMRS